MPSVIGGFFIIGRVYPSNRLIPIFLDFNRTDYGSFAKWKRKIRVFGIRFDKGFHDKLKSLSFAERQKFPIVLIDEDDK